MDDSEDAAGGSGAREGILFFMSGKRVQETAAGALVAAWLSVAVKACSSPSSLMLPLRCAVYLRICLAGDQSKLNRGTYLVQPYSPTM